MTPSSHLVPDRLVAERSPFPYLSCTVDLPPTVAQAALDASMRARRGGGWPPSWDVPAAGGHLELRGDGRLPGPARQWVYRELYGSIRHRWHPPISVRLELLPWSKTTTALGLSVPRRPFLTHEGVYLAVGSAALGLLAGEIVAWGHREVDQLEGWLDELWRNDAA